MRTSQRSLILFTFLWQAEAAQGQNGTQVAPSASETRVTQPVPPSPSDIPSGEPTEFLPREQLGGDGGTFSSESSLGFSFGLFLQPLRGVLPTPGLPHPKGNLVNAQPSLSVRVSPVHHFDLGYSYAASRAPMLGYAGQKEWGYTAHGPFAGATGLICHSCEIEPIRLAFALQVGLLWTKLVQNGGAVTHLAYEGGPHLRLQATVKTLWAVVKNEVFVGPVFGYGAHKAILRQKLISGQAELNNSGFLFGIEISSEKPPAQ
jgi:hypothetical protein